MERARGLALLDIETCATLARGRWRQTPLTRPLLALPLAVVLLLHALFVLMLWHEMQPRLPHQSLVPIDMGQTLIVRMLDDSRTPRAVPPPAPPNPPGLVAPRQLMTSRIRPVPHKNSPRGAMVMQDHAAIPAPATSVATPAIHLFAKDGLLRLPPMPTDNSATASTKTKPAKPADDRQIMQHDSNRMHYKATRFEKYFPPPNETAVGAVGRHIGDTLKAIAKSMCDPSKSSTVANPLCAPPPLPPSPKDDDERLNLPPSSLADDPHPGESLPLSTCIAHYKANQPLPYGCPADTPDLAFKAEMRECIDLFRAGKRLKTWCPLDTPQRAAAELSTPAAARAPVHMEPVDHS